MGVFDSVVITGGKGMLAHALSDALCARGVEAVSVARAECDISRRDQVHRLFEKYRPTLLLNAAAHTKVDQCEDEPELANAINGDGPGYLAELSRQHGTRFTHFSTDFVFDGQSDRPYLPSDRPNPVSAYGVSKLLGENRIREVNPKGWLVVRTAWLFGRHGHCFPTIILTLARSGKVLKVVNDQFGCPTLTTDLAETTLQLIEKNASGMYHLTGAGKTSWFEFASAILEVFGVKTELIPVSTAQWLQMRPQQAVRPAFSVLDCSGTVAVTGKTLRPWLDALQQYRWGLETTN